MSARILIGVAVVLLLAYGFGGYGADVEQRNVRATSARSDVDEYQRDECASWRGWPKHYHPWFCEEK